MINNRAIFKQVTPIEAGRGVQAYIVGRRFYRAVDVAEGMHVTLAVHDDERGYHCVAAFTHCGVLLLILSLPPCPVS